MKCTHCGRPMFSYWLALLVLMAILLVLACGVVEVITRIRGR